MLSTVSAPAVLVAASSTSSEASLIAGAVSGLVAGVILYLLVYRRSAHRLPEVRVEEAPRLVKKLGGQIAGFVCAVPTGMMVGFVCPAASRLPAGPLLLVVHLMGAAMMGVSIAGIAWLTPRLRVAQKTAAG